jgi:putative endopeptidase
MSLRHAILAPVLGVLLLGTPIRAIAAAPKSTPMVGPWGVAIDYIDPTIKPGADFFTYVNNGWLKTAQIPPDRSAAGTFLDLIMRNDDRLKAIFVELHGRTNLTEEEKKLRDLYEAYMDTTQIESSALQPAAADLARINAAASLEDVARIQADPSLRLDGPFAMRIQVDDKDPDAYVVRLTQSGLGLPDRDYYLKGDASLDIARRAYQDYLARMLAFAGRKDAPTRAAAVYALEKQIATASWPAADRRDADKTYNPLMVSKLAATAPGFPWAAYLEAAGIPARSSKGERLLNVGELSAFPKLAEIFAATPVDVWRDYLAVQYMHAFADFLPREVDDLNFVMYGTALQGRSRQLPRAARGARVADRRMGEALGKIFVREYFPPESKARVETLVQNLLKACRRSLEKLDWMSPETRTAALTKLDKFTVKVGYPSHWRDYSALHIDRSNLVASIKNTNSFEWNRRLKRLDQVVDRSEWIMSAPTVNAYYEPVANEIVFPAGILQPPFFDPNADDAVNYGSIGCTIGHEISHGFDDQGSKYDGHGTLRMWWTDADRKQFDERAEALAKQYDAYEPLPGLHVNGHLTLGENLADLAGVRIAHAAYKISLNGKPAPVLNGYTGDQRFYLAYAQYWRYKTTDAAMRQRVMSNEHSPGEYRVNGVVRNDDGWYAAFPDVKPGDSYYLPPERRIRIW